MVTIQNNNPLAGIKCAVALGNFDGVHKGHATLIRKTVALSREYGLSSCVYTFSEHPSNFKNGFYGIITDNSEKQSIIESLGADIFYLDDFDKVKDLSCEEFCRDILVKKLGAEIAVCGKNYRFGKNREGDCETLKKQMEALGKKTVIIDYVTADSHGTGEAINSTSIRRCISEGETEKAAELMGRPFSICYPVIYGRQLGRKLGFPTINQKFPKEKLRPKNGVYACLCTIDGKEYPGVANVGTKPTVTAGESKPPVLCETHIIGYDGDLYGKRIKLDFYRRLRDEKKFSDLDELTRAVKSNIEETKKYFEEKKGKGILYNEKKR